MDHWYYFGRIGAYKWTNKQEDYMVTCLASFSTLSSLTLDLINEFTVLYSKMQLEKDYSVKNHLKAKFSWFIGRICDIPVSISHIIFF